MWVHWGLCKDKKIRGVLDHYCDDVDQGGGIGFRLLGFDGEELEPSARRGEFDVWSRVVSWSSRGEDKRSARSKVGVIPSSLVLDVVDMCLSGSGGVRRERAWT